MKQFFKFVLATIVGIIIVSILSIFFIVGIITVASSDKAVEVDSNSLLHIKINYDIKERTPNNPFAGLGF
jgi:protease-4